ncbi:hypothetical protein [Cumulibacter manganitolerans]|uniref:hypothetical protein n=1 Tax=Cumulibacter manganitolerans TaxID=1884992 RepID=UPI001E52003C|nr:hypothetical protein [Cumulibacter manganitolerans]
MRGALLLACGSLLLAGCTAAAPPSPATDAWQVEVVADGLEHPWGLALRSAARCCASIR